MKKELMKMICHVGGGAALSGAVTISSTLALISTTNNLSSTAVDVFASDPGYAGTVLKVRASRGTDSNFKLIEAQNNSALTVFSVRGDGAVTVGGTMAVSGAVTVSGALTLTGALTLSSTLALTSTTSNAATGALDVLVSDAGYAGTVVKVRASRGSNSGFALIEAQNSGTATVFSVRGDGALTISGTATVGGDLVVAGQSTLMGELTVTTGLAVSSGNLRVGCSVYLSCCFASYCSRILWSHYFR